MADTKTETMQQRGAISDLRKSIRSMEARISELERGRQCELQIPSVEPIASKPKIEIGEVIVDVLVRNVRGTSKYRPMMGHIAAAKGDHMLRRVQYFLEEAPKQSHYAIWQQLYGDDDLLPMEGNGRYLMRSKMVLHDGPQAKAAHTRDVIRIFDVGTVEWVRLGNIGCDIAPSEGLMEVDRSMRGWDKWLRQAGVK